jgi:hypothetical protein
MKKIFVLIFSVSFIFSLFSEPQSSRTARKISDNFVRGKAKILNFSDSFALEVNGVIVCYIFNYEPNAFVAVSADSDVFPVVAYSFRNKFSQKESIRSEFLIRDLSSKKDFYRNNPVLAEANYIEWQHLLNGNVNSREFRQWPEAATTLTGGWVETNWDQFPPYNNFCPIDDLGERSKVGCVATAMAQIINYHEFIGDPVLDDSDDYFAGDSIDIDDDFAERDFPSFPVLNSYLDTLGIHYGSGIPLTDNDLATLNFAAAVTCEMQFSSIGSGASTGFVDNALTETFGYHSAQYYYEDSDFYETLKQNMIHRKPAQLSIWRSYRGGHSIVCDGYNTDDFYHLNMGWATTDSTFWFHLPDLPNNYESVTGGVVDITPLSREYRSVGSGNWYDPGVWEVNDNRSWVAATSLPTSFSQMITIQAGDEITISQNVRVDEIVVESEGQLTIAENTVLFLNDGSGEDLQVFGFLEKRGSITRSDNAIISVKDGGIYKHNTDISVSTVNWETGSTCEIIGVGEDTSYLTLENVDQEFYHFIWNCPEQSGNVGFLGELTHINGDFELINSNDKDVRLVYNNNREIIVEGNITISGGVLELTNGQGDCDLNCYGDFIFSGGTVRLKSGSSGSVWAYGVLICRGDYIQSGGEITQDGSGNGEGRLRFEGSDDSCFWQTGGIFDPENIAVRSTEGLRYLTLQSEMNIGSNIFTIFGTLDFGEFSVNGSGDFDLRSSGVLKTANHNGINGSVQVTGTKTFDPAADYEFNGNAAQVTGSFLPIEITDGLKINNNSGVTLSQNTTISGGNSGLELLLGKLIVPTNSLLTFATDGSWDSAGENSFISGTVTKIIDSTAGFLFPIGKDTLYAPLQIFPVTTDETVFKAEYFDEPFSDITTCEDSLENISSVEYWTLERTSGNTDANVRLYWNENSFESFPESLVVAGWKDTLWINEGQFEIDVANKNITSYAVSDFAAFTFGDIVYPNSVPPEAPSNTQVIISESNVTISWNEVTEAASYTVYSSYDPYAETWDIEESGITDTEWNEEVSESKKFYRVTADN